MYDIFTHLCTLFYMHFHHKGGHQKDEHRRVVRSRLVDGNRNDEDIEAQQHSKLHRRL